jgi:hypothetical protein
MGVGRQVNLKVIRIDSVKTQLPYEYYALPFCQASPPILLLPPPAAHRDSAVSPNSVPASHPRVLPYLS